MMLQAFLCLAYLVQLCKSTVEKQSVIRFGIPAFINMTCFCAVNEYRLLSGAFSYEVALTVLFLSYEMYWERNEKGESYLSNSECNADVQQIDEQTVRIAIRADENVNGIADLYLDYEVKKSDRLLAKLII